MRSNFSTPESKINYDNLRIGVLIDYKYGKSSLGRYLKANANAKNISYATSNKGIVYNLERLLGGEIDITIADKKVLVDLLEKNPILASELKIIHPHDTNKIKLYVGFSSSLANADHLARVVDAYVLKSAYSGELEDILKKYNLSQEDYLLFKNLR